MIESLCMIFAKFSCCILMINSYFPHAMKMYTIQGSPKVHLFLSDFLLLEILNKINVFDKMVKLINMLVEPRT
jgi:hypothetical protein